MPKRTKDPKDKILHIRCSLALYERVEEEAKRHKQTVSAFLHSLVEKYTYTETKVSPVEENDQCIRIQKEYDDNDPDIIRFLDPNTNPETIDHTTRVMYRGKETTLYDISNQGVVAIFTLRRLMKEGKTLHEAYLTGLYEKEQKARLKKQNA